MEISGRGPGGCPSCSARAARHRQSSERSAGTRPREADIAASSPRCVPVFWPRQRRRQRLLAGQQYLPPVRRDRRPSGKGGFPDGFRPDPWTPADSAVSPRPRVAAERELRQRALPLPPGRKVDAKRSASSTAAARTLQHPRRPQCRVGTTAVAIEPRRSSRQRHRGRPGAGGPVALTRCCQSPAPGAQRRRAANAAAGWRRLERMGRLAGAVEEWLRAPRHDPTAVSMPSVWFRGRADER